MNKKGLIEKTRDVLKNNDIRKPVSVKSEKFRIASDGGDNAVFTVDREDKRIPYNARDVANILDALIAVIEDCMRRGEQVAVRGFGSLEIRKVKEHRVREPEEEIWHIIPEQYRPKFTAGCDLAAAARSYGLQEDDVGAERFLPDPDDYDDMDDEEDGVVI